MKTERETIFVTSINQNRIIKLTVFDFDTSSRLVLTKFERNFLGLDDSIFICLEKENINGSNDTDFVIKKSDTKYYEMFKELLLKFRSSSIIASNRTTKKGHHNGYTISDEENGIKIKDNNLDGISTIEFIERDKKYSAFNSLFSHLMTQQQIEKDEKVKKIVYKTNI